MRLSAIPYPLLAVSAVIMFTLVAILIYAFHLTPALFLLVPLALLALGLHLHQQQPLPEATDIAANTAKPERPVVLIIGPYAAKWFSQSGQYDKARYADQTTWLLIAEAKELLLRLNYLRGNAPNAPLRAFFPFLPDGHETSDQIVKQLELWQQSLTAIAPTFSLPCTFAIYARLSNERRNNSPDNATWSGDLDLRQASFTDYDKALSRLKKQLKSRMLVNIHSAQRAIMGDHLFRWLNESGIGNRLSLLFTQSALPLNDIILCDYGNGFTRHGAWSHWLEQHYAILPALGSSLTLPPTPHVLLPEIIDGIPTLPESPPPAAPKMYWSVILIFLLLCAHLLNTTWTVQQQQLKFQHQMLNVPGLDSLSINKVQGYVANMQNMQRQWSDCKDRPLVNSWGLSPCKTYSRTIDERISQLKNMPSLTTAGSGPTFSSGSAVLLPAALPTLLEIASLAREYPQHKLLIIGHTDNTGSDNFNLSIAAQRAISVRDWLLKEHIPASQLATRSAGATEPVASNDTANGRQQNRRVEVLILPTFIDNKEFTRK